MFNDRYSVKTESAYATNTYAYITRKCRLALAETLLAFMLQYLIDVMFFEQMFSITIIHVNKHIINIHWTMYEEQNNLV